MDNYHLTFNKPGMAKAFGQGQAHGVHFKIEGGEVFFKAVTGSRKRGSDILPYSDRSRGGGKFIVGGEEAERLFQALTLGSTGIYYILQGDARGWLKVVPTNSADAPSKFTPHMRLWPPKTATRIIRLAESHPWPDATRLRQQITQAQQTAQGEDHAALSARSFLDDLHGVLLEVFPPAAPRQTSRLGYRPRRETYHRTSAHA